MEDGVLLRREIAVRMWVMNVLDSEVWKGEMRKLFSRDERVDGVRFCRWVEEGGM